MQRDIMSSEDSEVEAGDEIVVVRKLPWRSDQVSTLMKQVDAKLKIDYSTSYTAGKKKAL